MRPMVALCFQIVEGVQLARGRRHAIAARQKFLGERPSESGGSAGDEPAFGHAKLTPFVGRQRGGVEWLVRREQQPAVEGVAETVGPGEPSGGLANPLKIQRRRRAPAALAPFRKLLLHSAKFPGS
jgi:hypothetical protein